MHLICYNTGMKRHMHVGVFCLYDVFRNEKENKQSSTEEKMVVFQWNILQDFLNMQ